jgi:osmotically-inducible protein OsmY
MESKRSALRFGTPVRFRDRWQGRLISVEIEDDWALANVIVARGIFRPSQVKLPFSIASDWNDDFLALDCSSGEAFGKQIQPLAVPPQPLSAATPVAATRTRLAGVMVDRSGRRVTALILGSGRFGAAERLASLGDVSVQGGAISLAVPMDLLPSYRRDAELLQAVRDALADHPHLTADDRRGISEDVMDGVAYLSGNVRTPQARASAHAVAASVPGVVDVEDGVRDDGQLEIDIGRALDAAGLFRRARIYVRSALGAVSLGGYVSSESAIAEIVRVTSRVPGVRSVQSGIQLDERSASPAA